VLFGHWVAYILAVPQPLSREAILLGSGHSYWLVAVKLAAVLVATGLGTVVLRHLGAKRPPNDEAVRRTSVIARLVSLQVIAFTALEASERIAAHAPLASMFQHQIFFVGIALQILIACVGGILLVLFSRTVARIARTLRSAPSTTHASVRFAAPLSHLVLASGSLSGAFGVRGPPQA
jgi:hypothetical protein